jgi:hypothetical protein
MMIAHGAGNSCLQAICAPMESVLIQQFGRISLNNYICLLLNCDAAKNCWCLYTGLHYLLGKFARRAHLMHQ